VCGHYAHPGAEISQVAAAARAGNSEKAFSARPRRFKLPDHMIALYFLCYNFGRVHQTLRVTSAMEAGISDHVWSIEEICHLLPARKPAA
jgi:hypothetical protein